MRRLKRRELNDWPKVLELSSGKQGPLTPRPRGLLLQAPPAGWFCPLPHSQGPSLWACALRGHTSPVKGGLRLGGWPATEYSGYGAREPTTPKAVNSLGVTTQEKQALWDRPFPRPAHRPHTPGASAPWGAPAVSAHVTAGSAWSPPCLLSPPSHPLNSPALLPALAPPPTWPPVAPAGSGPPAPASPASEPTPLLRPQPQLPAQCPSHGAAPQPALFPWVPCTPML